MRGLFCTRRAFLATAATGLAAAAAGQIGCTPKASASGHGDASAASADGLISAEGFAFDTFIALQAACDRSILDSALNRCFYFESIFSRTLPQSDIAELNAAGGRAVSVNPETADIIRRSLEYSNSTGGCFDITIGAVSELWDFKQGIVPDDAAIEQALGHVGYQGVSVRGSTVRMADPDARIDLGGIAKGYIADDLAQMLAEAGCRSACLDLGGTIRTIGAKPDGTPWRIGIQDPFAEGGALVETVDATDGSVTTSGLSERCFTKDGKRFWHILDPRTGYPAESRIESASIIGPSATDGEAFAKPLFMMDADAARKWIGDHPLLEAVLVDRSGEVSRISPAATR